jgi:hypothetical protein
VADVIVFPSESLSNRDVEDRRPLARKVLGELLWIEIEAEVESESDRSRY